MKTQPYYLPRYSVFLFWYFVLRTYCGTNRIAKSLPVVWRLLVWRNFLDNVAFRC